MFDKFITYLIVNKILTFKEDKVLLMNKTPFVMFPARSMARFSQKIAEDFGEDYLYELGYDAGLSCGKNLVEDFGWKEKSLYKKIGVINNMFEVMGWGKMDIKKWNAKTNEVNLRITNNPAIEWGKKLFGKKSKVCYVYMGAIAAHGHNEMGIENSKFVQKKCICNGAEYCEFENINTIKQ